MITHIRTLIISIFCLLPLIPAAAQHVSVNLKLPPPNQLGIADLWNLTLNNTSQNSLHIYLEGTVDEASDGRILEARSKAFELGPGIKSITANDVSGASITYKNNKYKEAILRTGNAPPGSYYFCVYVKLEDGSEAGSDCKNQSIMNLSPPVLISPTDGLSIAETYPSFSWMPPAPVSPTQNISYSIKIAEIYRDESPENAIKRSGYEMQDLRQNLFQYPVSAPALEKDKSYAWQITAYLNGNSVGKSEIWRFSYESNKIVTEPNYKDFIMVTSNIYLELDRTVYPQGTSISATLYIDSGDVNIKYPAILYSAPQSKDIEAIKLVKTNNDSIYVTEHPLPIKPYTSEGDVKMNDGYLTLKPNEMFFAIYFPKDSADIGNLMGADLIADFGIMEDKNFRDSPFEVMPELAMTEDEINILEGGKRIGTVTTYKGIPIQLPVEELIIYPRSDKQLRRFLQRTNGEIVMTNSDSDTSKPTGYLVKVHTDVRLQDFSQVRAVTQRKDIVYASNADVLRVITLCLELMLDGYMVEVNPRLQFGNSYEGNNEYKSTSENLIDIPMYNDAGYGQTLTDTAFNIPRAWSYMQLWDADEKPIPVGIIDMGFNYSPDFRGTRDGIIEHDMKTGSDQPRSAEGPPTVGNSFFGDKSWHGTGVVTTAGGVINNKFGSGGTGGQVVEPILISVGLSNYAFDMGKGIKIATDKGANVINISGGYPCKLLTSILPPLGICSSGERFVSCQAIAHYFFAAASVSAEATCFGTLFIPFGLGIPICAAARAAALGVLVATEAACNASLLAGELKSEMVSGVNYALSKGVTVVSISGNTIVKNNLPAPLKDIVNTDDRSVDDWEIIPGVISGVICVAACDPSAPYANGHYFGNRVDIWAPQNGLYWAPPNTTNIEEDPKKLVQKTINATSSAAPYISGLIADMQALNDSLNPKKAPLSEITKIPGKIRNLLVDNAYQMADLSKYGVNLMNERRNMVNPLKTLIAASPQVIRNFQDYSLKGYNTRLGYDESDTSRRHDVISTAFPIPFFASIYVKQKFSDPPTTHGVVGLIDGSKYSPYKDVDWFKIIYPSQSGIYGDAHIQVTIPDGSVWKFGRIKINGTLYPPLQNSITPDESTIDVKLPDMLDGCEFPISIAGYLKDDNVYKLYYIPGKRLGDAPEPDRFDRVFNPFGNTDNNSKNHSVPLGQKVWVKSKGIPFETDEYNWTTVKQDKDNIYYEIDVADLNFHTCNDEDWFSITPPAGLTDLCSQLMCGVPITVSCTYQSKPVNVLISVEDKPGNSMYEDELSSWDILCGADPTNGYPLYVKLRGAGQPIKYDLKVSCTIPTDVPKALKKCKEMWEWVNTLKYPPIKLNQNWWCEWGTDPVMFNIDWANNGGITLSSDGGMSFFMQGNVPSGVSMSMQLFNSQGNLMTQSFTPDFNSPNADVKQAETKQGNLVLNLEYPNLPEGTYYLVLTGGTQQSEAQSNFMQGNYVSLPEENTSRNMVQLLLPRALLKTNSPAVEDFVGQGQFSGDASSSFTLIPASANQILIFK